MIIATEKLGCSSSEKYDFERTYVVCHGLVGRGEEGLRESLSVPLGRGSLRVRSPASPGQAAILQGGGLEITHHVSP